MIKIRVKLTIVLCIRLLEVPAYGTYRDPIAKTNINPKTDLFEKEIEDYGTFRDHMGSLREQAAQGIGAPGNLELISDKTDDEIKAAASDLNAIKANDLQVKGQEEVLRTDMMELHVDYTDPLIAGHKKDASRIAEASGVLLGKLTELFKEFGIDCRTVKGNKVIEPEYYIDVKKEQVKDTVYTKTMCEELRNRYSCHDVLTTKCKRRGAVGELKYIVRMTWYHAVGGLGFYGKTKLGYEYDFYLSRDGEIDLSPFFPEIKRIMNKRPFSLSLTAAFETIDVDKIILPPQRYIPYKITLQQRTGEWIEKDFTLLPLFQGGLPFPLFYYDEGCVEWVDEWDEVCGLES